MSARRLAFFGSSAYTLGGVQVWLDSLVKYLISSTSWQVDVVLASGIQHNHHVYQAAYPDLPVTPLTNATGSAEGRRRAICSYLLEKNPDLVVGVNLADLYPAICRARSRGFAGKVAFSLHAIDPDLLADIRTYSGLLDAVIATNRLSCALVERYTRLDISRVLYAPYGVNTTPIIKYSSGSPRLRIAWVGRLEQPQKRVHDLAGILRCLDNAGLCFDFTIAGDGPEASSLRVELEPWIASGNVVMVGALSGPELVRQVYATHDALLITSQWETGPIVAWEAMAAEMALVSTCYVGSGLEEALVHDKTALMFPVGDVDKAALAIQRLHDSTLRARLCQAGKELLHQRYNIHASCDAWIEAFDRVLTLPEQVFTSPEPPLLPSGRLDRLIGIGAAESLRKRLGVRFQHFSPGGEWPHTANGGSDEQALLELAGALDRHA